MGLVELQERQPQAAKPVRPALIPRTAGRKEDGGISVGRTVNGTACDSHGNYIAGGYECRGIAGDLLALDRAGSVKLDEWERGMLRRVRTSEEMPGTRERLAVHRIRVVVDWWLWWELPPPCVALAERAAREALDVAAGVPNPAAKKKTRRKTAFVEAEIRCPVCRTGAVLYCWTGRGGRPVFICRNTRCVKKI